MGGEDSKRTTAQPTAPQANSVTQAASSEAASSEATSSPRSWQALITQHTPMATLAEKLAGKMAAPPRESPAASPAELDPESTIVAEEDEEWVWTPCYSARKELGATIRLDFRCANGNCISLPYHSLVDIQFLPHEDPEIEWIKFDYTPYWYVEIGGSNLERIYGYLKSHSVSWLRQGDESEQEEGQPFIKVIDFVKLTDPAVTMAALNLQRQSLLEEAEPVPE